MAQPNETARPTPARLLAALALDFFRWSQLTPMILMWAMMLGLLFILFFIGNEDAVWTALERTSTWLSTLPVIGPGFVDWLAAQAGEDGTIHISPGGTDFRSAVLTAWGLISAVFMFLGWIAGVVFGPFTPWTLKRKLGAAALACVLVLAAFVALYVSDSEMWNGSPSQAVFSLSGMAIVLFVVSAWCVTASHALGWLSGAVANGMIVPQAGAEDHQKR
jgi:uncharacterized membrane protein YdcZ (DUF606 family)